MTKRILVIEILVILGFLSPFLACIFTMGDLTPSPYDLPFTSKFDSANSDQRTKIVLHA